LKNRFLITCLIIFSVTSVYEMFHFQKLQNQQHEIATTMLIQCLTEAGTSFEVDYTKMDDETKMDNYMRASSNLHTAIYIMPYAIKFNQELINALSELNLIMTANSLPNSTNRWIAVTEKEQAIFKYLHNISVNPNDKNSCEALYKIAKDIRIRK